MRGFHALNNFYLCNWIFMQLVSPHQKAKLLSVNQSNLVIFPLYFASATEANAMLPSSLQLIPFLFCLLATSMSFDFSTGIQLHRWKIIALMQQIFWMMCYVKIKTKELITCLNSTVRIFQKKKHSVFYLPQKMRYTP